MNEDDELPESDDWTCAECGYWDWELIGVGQDGIRRCMGCGMFDDDADPVPPEKQRRTSMRSKDDVGR